jgi:hypothetical protein
LNEQQKYDGMVSNLADGVERILPFVRKVQEQIHDDEGLLEGVIKGLYDIVMDTATFICSYVRRSPLSMSIDVGNGSNSDN